MIRTWSAILVSLFGVVSCGSGGSGGSADTGQPTEATPELRVTPQAGLVAQGEVGGPFLPGGIQYVVSNPGNSSIAYTVSVDQNFVKVSPAGGALGPKASDELTVTIDPSVSSRLAVGSYRATVKITEKASGAETSRSVSLEVLGVGPSAVTVVPATGLFSAGVEGGPFAPSSTSFTVINRSAQSLLYEAEVDRPWLVLGQSGGQVGPGQSQGLTLSIDTSIASGLTPGSYVGELLLTDLTNNVVHTRDVRLLVSSVGAVAQVTQLSQFGITWSFDRAYPSGRFANGDYWVLGPLQVIDIEPASITSEGRTLNGSMVNPSPRLGMRQGYDSDMYGQYRQPGDFDATLNVAAGISAAEPLRLATGSSLVSTISEPQSGVRPQIRTAAILTVLDSVPQPGDFRPPYSGTDKTIQFNAGQLDPSLLRRLPIPSGLQGDVTSLAAAERMFERPWIDHVPLWIGGYIHPLQNMPDYGRDMVDQVGIAALLLHMDLDPTASDAQLFASKLELLQRFVQLGIDFFGVAMDGGSGNWRSAAGHMSGRKWPILFAGLMLDNPEMKEIGLTRQISFGEDDQTFVVQETSPGVYNQGYGGYTAADVGLAEWGTNHPLQPWFDDRNWFGDPYRLCCTANAWWGQLLAARVMGVLALWNHDVLFDYQDRYFDENINVYGVEDWRLSWRPWYLSMWKVYRPLY